MIFPTKYEQILDRMHAIQPNKYGKTRNFIDGDVTYLSPYISRGILSTRQIFEYCLSQGFQLNNIYKFTQELAWRDYWQQIWIAKGNAINTDLKRPQPEVENHKISQNIVACEIGINAIDNAINDLYSTGYTHNHLRMYVAALACNIGKSHWEIPAKWMYYHLLDADWASNALSWQWVSGANAGKKYYANQENINKYTQTQQLNTFLDTTYPQLVEMGIPDKLKTLTVPDLEVKLPKSIDIRIDTALPTYVYNAYNLDPNWDKNIQANRVLLLEPSVFEQYPMSEKTIQFILDLSQNICDIQIFTGEFTMLKKLTETSEIHYKEHPLNVYQGIQHARDWMTRVNGYFPSFFKFWKQAEKELKNHGA